MHAWTRFESPPKGKLFQAGSFDVRTRAFAGDGGTVQDQVELSLPADKYTLWLLDGEYGLDHAYLVAPGAKPVRWNAAGAVAVDTAVGCFATKEAVEALESLHEDDEEWLSDKVDDLLFVRRKTHGKVPVRRHPLFVFKLIGDGTYGVAEGIDAAGRTCVVIFGTAGEDWEEGDEAP